MKNPSCLATHLVSALKVLQDGRDIKKLKNILLEFFIYHKIKNSEQAFFSILHQLKTLNLVKIHKKRFHGIIVNNIHVQNNLISSNKNFINKKDISSFIKKIYSVFNVKKTKHSKYEARFFWPAAFSSEVYDIGNLIFDKKDYITTQTEDKYLLADSNVNIKIRKNELHVKTLLNNIGTVYQFTKKQKMTFPVKAKTIKDILNNHVISASGVFVTAEDLIEKLSHFSNILCVEVIKKRSVRKLDDHTKIEVSRIKIQHTEWKTICIESKHIENVLALSLLIRQENAERLSYNAFLQKYGTLPSR